MVNSMPSPHELEHIDQAHDEYLAGTDKAAQYDHDLIDLVTAARAVVNAGPDLYPDLAAALDQFEPWLEEDDDPRSMGWVDDKGRP